MMPDSFLTLGPLSVRLYTLVLALAVLISASVGVRHVRQQGPVGPVVDVYLGGLIGGMVIGRLVHVLLNWNYFAYNLNETFQLAAGGLDWHGAVIGGLIGLMIVARWRQVELSLLHDSLTIALPLLALAGWFGCWSAACGYGAEVTNMADYPALLVWEAPDVFGIYAPRFNTQVLGILVVAVILGIAMVLIWRDWLRHVRFWLVLVLLSAVMFGLGFLRGDYALFAGGLRLDQWLDLFMIGLGAFNIGRHVVGARHVLPLLV
jgi:phosphatidylglycerol---prolipoprotein diacylglyceryl transferase